MATAFRATSHGYRADLDAHERRLLSSLCGDVIDLLQSRTDEVAEDSAEPVTDEDAESTQHLRQDPVLAHFSAELAGLGGSEVLDAPRDEVLARLLPAASRDPEQAGQLRRLAEASLRESKIADLRTARMLLESSPVQLAEDQAPLFGRAINDVRLTLATRMEIRTEEDAERVHRAAVSGRVKNTETFMAEIYTFITWLQETLFTAMVEFLPEDEDDEEGRE
ncbi:DUF2017 family protein [Nesterenkonia xinjiangensis]|uniref:DUF2017 domain-containing protein n=1 Tax=Nesterenkonia xinjiangensis TaxID=225327 RepID=A0A7Z0KAI0_9MICC|nr:DUF2017 family protein [Nesterenkonia xinjiangensis]NYJ76642.1 hypothetical protein [Nesterenkonia xinjiangensis]